jgi:hypothetical protein
MRRRARSWRYSGCSSSRRSCGRCYCRCDCWCNSRSHSRCDRRRGRRRRCWRLTRSRCTTSNIDRVNAPTLVGLAGVAGHSPAQPHLWENKNWQVDHGRDEALRVAAPRLTASNRATAIGADCAVISAHREAPAGSKNVLECISAVSADLQHAAVKAEVGIFA